MYRIKEGKTMEEEVVGTATEGGADKAKAYYAVAKDTGMYQESKGKRLFKTVIYIFLSVVIYAVSFHYFVTPAKFAPGGIGGIVAMIQFVLRQNGIKLGGVDYSTLAFFLLNIPILVPAWKILSKDFVIKTLISTLLMTLIMFLMDNVIDPNYVFSINKEVDISDIGIRVMAAIFGGIASGLALAFALKANSSTGGADVIGAMIQKKNPHISVAKMIFVVNSAIMLVSFFIYQENLIPVFLAIIFIFASTITADKIMQGSQSALKFEVITEHAEDISREVIEKLGHGVTITPAKGMFEHKDKSLLICLIKPRQVAKFQDIIKKYPETFAYVCSVNEVIGKFNNSRGKK